MNPAEVVIHIVESYGVSVVLYFLAESVGEPGKSAHGHSHGKVLPLDVGCTDVRRVRVANDGLHVGADTLGGAVEALFIV